MKRVLFYNDVGGFGGHEVMALTLMRELAALGCAVHSMASVTNRVYWAEQAKISGVVGHQVPFRLHRYNYLTNHIDFPKINQLRCLLRQLAPDCVVAVQGCMEISSLILPAAKREGVPLVTYIALAQTMRALGVRHGMLRDFLARRLLAIPDRFVTIGMSQQNHLSDRGVALERIGIVPNVVKDIAPGSTDRKVARAQLELDPEPFTVGLVGRVVAAHKGHELLLATVSAHREQLASFRFVVVGDGPDRQRLQRQVKFLELEPVIRFLDWSTDMARIYSALDAVVMPSYHEGVPLVMIEAILNGLPVIASAIDGMKDHLPPEWLFPCGDAPQLASRLSFVATVEQRESLSRVRTEFERLFLRTTIGQEFLEQLELAERFRGQHP